MEECESYNLNWAEFESYTSKTFKNLLCNPDFADVTLVCDEDQCIEAHKVILSACSPFFNRILKKNSHQHPLVYLSDVNLNDLKAIVNFMYLGQTNVEQDNLQRFLKVAAKFQVRGLTENKNEEAGSTKSVRKVPGLNKVETNSSRKPSEIMNSSLTVNDEHDHLNYSGEENIKQEPSAELYYKDEDTDLGNVNLDHIDTSQFAVDSLLSNLTPTVSENNLYPCNQCDYKATYACNLTSHKRTVHQGLYYSCHLCPYKSSRKDRLNKHINSKHDSVNN